MLKRHEGKVLHKFAKSHEDGVNGLLERIGGSRSGMYYLLGKEKLDEKEKAEIAEKYNTNVQTIWPTSYPADLGPDGSGTEKKVQDIYFNALLDVLLTQYRDRLKEVIEEVLKEKDM